MAKQKKKPITLKEAIDRIPHDPYYCLDSGECPFWQLRNFSSKGKQYRKARKSNILGIPTYYCSDGRHQLEYCAFLRIYLWCQDGVKECGINCDDPEGGYMDPNLPSELNPVKQARIQNREYADMYKEKYHIIKEKEGYITEKQALNHRFHRKT